ncbi:MAG: transglutaminase domain-containing protein [Oligoflexia bacterium]|nr:transglutaminase domain-containing protein [Oligoflexia bacterium]MBF0366989.1 transglutaminase domain-containing protein [Oligoflexia bacterium]
MKRAIFVFLLGSFTLLSLSLPLLSIASSEDEIIRLLPQEYQAQVKINLSKAGSNRQQLTSAIATITPRERPSLGFILAHAPERDLRTVSATFLKENSEYAHKARALTPWGKMIPEEIFLNDVLPYANVTEQREQWRKDFYQRFLEVAIKEKSIAGAVKKLNQYVFDTFDVRYHATLRKKPDQSPYESIAIKYASCTGLSILIVDALRAVAIPARLAGIPLWPSTGGNHTWVEVWDAGSWHYIEAASPGEYDHTWFSERAKLAHESEQMSSIYAVSFRHTPTYFPLVWNHAVTDVHAVNVTRRYK